MALYKFRLLIIINMSLVSLTQSQTFYVPIFDK